MLDITSALHVLKQSKYINAAVKLAENTDRYIDCIGLLIEDLNDGKSALKMINRLNFDEVSCVVKVLTIFYRFGLCVLSYG